MAETNRETTKIFIWQHRRRGVLVVTAKTEADARQKALEHEPNFKTFLTKEPVSMPARAGEITYLRERRRTNP